MTIYLFDCNYKNEFLGEVQTETPEEWEGCYTEVPPQQSFEIGKSYAWNPATQQWDNLIDDWRGITLYSKEDSTVSKEGDLNPKPSNFIEIAPPDNEKKYVWNDVAGVWQEFVVTINPQDLIKQYEDAIQNYIDQVAKGRGYDNGYTCASYFEDKNARFASDARVFKNWRSDVWVQINDLLNNYASQIGSMETVTPSDLQSFPTIETIIASLPAIEWEEI